MRTAAADGICHFCSGLTRDDWGEVIHPGPKPSRLTLAEAWTYRLTADEVKHVERLAYQVSRVRKLGRDGQRQADKLDDCANGFAGEVALARLMGHATWLPTLDNLDDSPFGVEVRTRSDASYDLWLYRDEDKPRAPFALLTGSRATPLTARGWLFGPEAQRPAFWRQPKGTRQAGYFVPQQCLRSIATLAGHLNGAA